MHLKYSAHMKQQFLNCHLTDLPISWKGVLKDPLNNSDILTMFGDISGYTHYKITIYTLNMCRI